MITRSLILDQAKLSTKTQLLDDPAIGWKYIALKTSLSSFVLSDKKDTTEIYKLNGDILSRLSYLAISIKAFRRFIKSVHFNNSICAERISLHKAFLMLFECIFFKEPPCPDQIILRI